MPWFLAVTTTSTPNCPAGSAILRVELDEVAEGAWPGLVLAPDDGRDLWTPPPAPPVVPDKAPPGYVLRSLAWTDRLTMAELGAITLAASRGLEAGDPTLQVFLDTLGRATEVNVQDPRFVGALQAFAEAGLFDADRLPELLAPAAPGEAPS